MNNSTQSDEKKKELLRNTKTIAVVGASNDPYAASHRISKFLQNQGYKIVPVNPNYKKVLGETCYPDLKSIPDAVDLVDVFRQDDALLGVIKDAVTQKIPVVWLQAGLRCDEGKVVAEEAGVEYIDNCCIMSEHRRLIGDTIK